MTLTALLSAAILVPFFSGAQSSNSSTIYSMYASVQGNQVSQRSGSYSKTTADLEYGTTVLSTTGPIVYTVTPAALSIGSNESKTWNGIIKADPANIPLAGTSVPAVLKGDYTVGFSRPKGAGSNGTVISTHTCRGCDYHGEGVHGEHEKVEVGGADSLRFNVISIKLDIAAKDSVCAGDTIKLTATPYPGTGGTVTWSNGETGNSIQWIADDSKTFSAKLTIGGVSYTDSVFIFVGKPGEIKFIGPPPLFAGWEKNIKNVDAIKDKTKAALKAIPAKVTLTGPTVTLDYGEGDCCNNGKVIADGKRIIKGTITAGLDAHVPMASPPWTAYFEKDIHKFGYVFKLKVEYGLFLDVGAHFKGELGYRWDECIPEDCFVGEIGLDCPIELSIQASGEACVVNPNRVAKQCLGENQNGNRCRRMTKNWCQYCSSYNGPNVPAHTSQSNWCIGCPEFTIKPASIASSIYGKVTYNEKNCNEGIKFQAGIGKVVFTTGITIFKYDLYWSYTIWEGAQIYP